MECDCPPMSSSRVYHITLLFGSETYRSYSQGVGVKPQKDKHKISALLDIHDDASPFTISSAVMYCYLSEHGFETLCLALLTLVVAVQ